MISPAPIELHFVNRYGEKWLLRVAPSRETGELLGDETDWKPIEIRDDRLRADFILANDEWAWLYAAWRQTTGRELRKPSFARLRELLKRLDESGRPDQDKAGN